VEFSYHNARFAALALPILLVACGGMGDGGESEADAVPEAERYGGTAVIGSAGNLQSMNALVSTDYNSNNIQRHMLFMTTVGYDENINPIPYLAERWDTVRVAGDSLELTFQIRRDVRWHDGQPTTAEDVLFTYERAIDPRTAFPNMSNFDLYSRHAELVDDYTFRVRLRPHSEFLDIWAQTAIMPKHILGDVPPGELIQHPFRFEPVGNGPFRFTRYVTDQEWIFEANPDFPEALGGRPYLDRIVYRYIPESTTLLTELQTGNVDLYIAPNPSDAALIDAGPDTELRVFPFRAYDYIGWNNRLPFFRDARVRRALTMAINREQIVEALRYGYGEVGRSPVTPVHFSFDRTDPETLLPYDTAGARRLLTEAGWTPGPDGILRNAEGTQFRFELITNAGNDVRRDITEIVQAQLRPLGIVVEPRLIEFTTMISTLQGSLDAQGRRQRDFQAVVGGWVVYFRHDDADILACRNLDGPYQYVGYCNPQVDALMDTLGVMMDREAARPLWKEYQRLLVQDSPYTILYYVERIGGVRTSLQGAVLDSRGETITAKDWWILPGQRRATAATP
jgi:peptide/nickel transport system substrate-binding protein